MRLRLHLKIALWLLLAGILPLAIMSGYSMVRVKRTVQETTREAYASLAGEIAGEVGRTVRNGVNSVYFLAENLILTSAATDQVQLEKELQKTQRFQPVIKDLTFLDIEGNVKASALYSFRGTWSATSWYQQASKGHRVFTGVHSVLYPFDVVMTTAAPVFDLQSSNISGVLVGQLTMEPIWQIFADLHLGRNSKAMLIDNSGTIVASPNKNDILNSAPGEVLQAIKSGNSGFTHINQQGRKDLMVYVPLPDKYSGFTNGWHIIITQPVSQAYAPTASVWRGIMLAAAVSLIAVALVSTILSRHINSRLRPLIKATRSLGEGQFPIHLEHQGHDEIGELAEAFVKASTKLAQTSREIRNHQETLEELVETRTLALQETNTRLQQQIKERISMEEEHKRLEELFRQSQKMEAVGTLAGGIAHDFNNILQVITGQVQLLLIKKKADDPEVAALSDINQTVSRAAELVRRLLTFSRKMEKMPRRMNLNTMVSSTVKLLSRTIPKMIAIETWLDEELHDVMADYNQMEQVLMNLTSNGSDAMPEGGTLTIATENATVGADQSRWLGIAPGNYVVLSVSDTGIGMEESVKKRIFEPFFTSKEVGKGTGLGLSTVYGIVQSHDGHITCYSEPGRGTRFFIYLPVIAGAAKSEEVSAPEEDNGVLSGVETIMVVDDEDIVREIAEDMLSRFGYKIYLCHNGETALEKFTRHAEEIDLVITDLGMPGMGGRKLIDHLLAIDPSVKIIVASGYADPATNNGSASSLPANSFIQKPYQLKKMLKTIRHTLDS